MGDFACVMTQAVLEMCIRDSPQNEYHKIFQRFYRGSSKEVMEKSGKMCIRDRYILSAVMHADERNRAMSEALGEDVYHYHLQDVYKRQRSAT